MLVDIVDVDYIYIIGVGMFYYVGLVGVWMFEKFVKMLMMVYVFFEFVYE